MNEPNTTPTTAGFSLRHMLRSRSFWAGVLDGLAIFPLFLRRTWTR